MRRGAIVGLIFMTACSSAPELAPNATPAPVTSAAPTSTSTTSMGVDTTSASTSTTASTTATTTTSLPMLQEVVFTPVVTDLVDPLFATAPSGDAAIYVIEQAGIIRRIDGDQSRVFLDIRGLVTRSGNEQGLLGMAFHPDFPGDPRVFVDYTGSGGGTVVASYRLEGDVLDPDSAVVLLEVPQPASNHNGGMVAFGPDGYLYVGLGDGGASGDRFGNGQRPDTLLATLLRLDVSSRDGYEIPPDNPFLDKGGAPEVWAYGLRNPWRFSFDDGLLYIADVGQGDFEEIDAAPNVGGLNFGWPTTEGFHCYSPRQGCDSTGLTAPVLEYDHSEGCSVTGGYVYRGPKIPELSGHYFYSDFCSGWIRSFRYGEGAVTDEQQWSDGIGNVTSFGLDGSGELLVVTRQGTVYRMEPIR